MELKHNARIFAADAREIGHLERVVVDPMTQELTHLVVRQGLWLGELKLVPISAVDEALEDQITLDLETDAVRALPPFEQEREVRVDGIPRSDLAPGLGGLLDGYGAPTVHRLITRTELNIPEGTVAVKEGARIITADGRQEGALECIAIEPSTRQITHLQITKGLLHRERRLIPSAWVVILGEDQIHLSVDHKTLAAVGPQPN